MHTHFDVCTVDCYCCTHSVLQMVDHLLGGTTLVETLMTDEMHGKQMYNCTDIDLLECIIPRTHSTWFNPAAAAAPGEYQRLKLNRCF